MEYIFIYDEMKVIFCTPFVQGNSTVFPPYLNILVASVDDAKMILDSNNINYSDIAELN